jgi:hypothetical protein
MSVNSTFTDAVLTHYTFCRQFEPTEPTSAALARMTALYSRYHVQIAHLMLSEWYDSTLVDEVTGRSLLPSSLTDLQVGQLFMVDTDRDSVYLCDLIKDDDGAQDSSEDRVELYRKRMMAPYLVDQGSTECRMNEPLLPGALPPKFECLQLGSAYNHPLLAGALPSSLTRLLLGRCFNQPLLACQLPSSLTLLAFGEDFDQPLLPGVLPPSLLELELGWAFNQPLQPGSLPPGLRRLTMSGQYNHPIPPGVLPSSLTHLHFGKHYNQPLQVGSLPSGLVQLYCDREYNQPLTAGVLPSSLRELHFVTMWNEDRLEYISSSFDHPILPGQLPDGLESLVLPRDYRHEVGVGVLPDGLLVLDLGFRYFSRAIGRRGGVIPHGLLPRGLRWLRMRWRYHRRVKDMLPPDVQCCWHDEGEVW